jgi:hypothetical protein
MSTLSAHPDFQKFLEYLNGSLNEIASESASTKDEVVLRWQQGAMQVLQQTIESCRNAQETLRKFR